MVAMWAVSIFRTGLRRWLIILIAVSTGSLVSIVLVNHPSYVMNMKQHGAAGLQTHAIQDKIVTLTDFNQKCVDPDSAGGVEDTLCLKRPTYLPNFQNPCFLDWVQPLQKLRCLPYFHVLGVDKSGTTDLHARIALHPQVLLNNGALGKETYFWCWLKYGQWMKGVINPMTFSDYLRAFAQPTATIAINLDLDGNHSLITGDGTPMDFWDFRAWPLIPQNRGLPEPIVLTPHLMRHIYPDPKFIIILRNPTDRLYSDYIFLGYGWTPEKFRQDVPRAISMMEACLKVNTTRQCVFSNDTYVTLPMRLHIGMYSVFMREWLDVFPLSHFYILRTEDYTVNMTRHLQQIFKFLRLEALPEKALQDIAEKDKRHETAAKKKVNDMFPETRHQLNQFYSRYNQELARMLGDEGFLWPSSPESQTATLVDSFLNLSNLSKVILHQ